MITRIHGKILICLIFIATASLSFGQGGKALWYKIEIDGDTDVAKLMKTACVSANVLKEIAALERVVQGSSSLKVETLDGAAKPDGKVNETTIQILRRDGLDHQIREIWNPVIIVDLFRHRSDCMARRSEYKTRFENLQDKKDNLNSKYR